MFGRRTKERHKELEKRIGTTLYKIVDSAMLIGSWRGSFVELSGASQSPTSRYRFATDEYVLDDAEADRWSLSEKGELSLWFTVPPDPEIPGLEDGAASEECYYAFHTDDGRVVLSNDDTSYVQLLSREVL
jgi:Tfp pilus tip-associated adhesin PilY1